MIHDLCLLYCLTMASFITAGLAAGCMGEGPHVQLLLRGHRVAQLLLLLLLLLLPLLLVVVRHLALQKLQESFGVFERAVGAGRGRD